MALHSEPLTEEFKADMMLCSGDNRFLGAGWKIHRYEKLFGIHVVISGLIFDSQLPQAFRIYVWNHLIELTTFEGSWIFVVVDAD